ncbi:hypothetical protein K466DRAFT_248293 [Polyporus arcularius HHB13444]|uniref:F-box domain-containing protein n=1 Tax=Polyporus arcularius HHB13444 TaxID=1314778 RepID=A0A5C3PR60_9APHY|nr:hypothetical protein K466DRAFT_248293 [Polyporus arcularius HHB13444]
MILDAISTSHLLEELMIDFGKVKYGNGVLLRTIAQHHLRKLTITGITNTIRNSMTVVSSLGQLAPILAELELPDYAHRCAAARVVFPGVRKLGIYVSVSSTYASSLARSFPNLTHLVLRSRSSNARGYNMEIGFFDQARVEHRRQWQENRSLWPSLIYVQAEDPVFIYILGFPRYIRHVSAWWATQTPSNIFPTIVADMRPDTLELCLTRQYYYGLYGLQ